MGCSNSSSEVEKPEEKKKEKIRKKKKAAQRAIYDTTKKRESVSQFEQQQWKLLEEEEDQARKRIDSNESRNFLMLLSDLEQALASCQNNPLALNSESFSDDEGARKCSMNIDQKEKVVKVGREHQQKVPSLHSGNPYSREAVATHNCEGDAWVIVRGKIYNVTSFVDEHPGGVWALLGVAGTDATSQFDLHHDTQVYSQLQKYFIANVE